MPAYDIDFPILHPKYIVSDISYYDRIAKKSPISGKIISTFKRLKVGDFKGVWGAFKRFMKFEESKI